MIDSARSLAADAEWEIRARQLADGVRQGRHRSARHGRGLEFAQHNTYNPGDDIRLLDWKAYARTDRLLVREAETESDHRFHIIVDNSRSMKMASNTDSATKFEAARTLVAALAMIAERQGDGYALTHFGSAVCQSGQGRKHLSRVMATLLSLESSATGRPDTADMSRLNSALAHRTTDVFFITDGYQANHELDDWVRDILGQRVQLTCVLLTCDIEHEWPYQRAVRGLPLEHGQSAIVTASAGRRFVAERQAQIADLARRWQRAGARTAELNIDQDLAIGFRRLF